jgi:hypothetical protein
MSERTIAGVDFSGAQSDNKTWITKGLLETEDSLELKKGSLLLLSCKSVSREELTKLLEELPCDAVAALDFPFSVPIAFSEFLERSNGEMPDLWQVAASMEREEFIAQRDEFVKEYGELLRAGDLHVPGCYSCLHKANPNMVPMTFHGMKMLDTLWEQTNCQVPPLEIPGRDGAVLLEVMPGAALRAFQLPDKGYKGGQKAFEARLKILRGLRRVSDVKVINLSDFHEECMFSDDALDSVAASVVAALWAMDESESAFKKPRGSRTVNEAFNEYKGKRKISPGVSCLTEEEAARKEGWIYVPKPGEK